MSTVVVHPELKARVGQKTGPLYQGIEQPDGTITDDSEFIQRLRGGDPRENQAALQAMRTQALRGLRRAR